MCDEGYNVFYKSHTINMIKNQRQTHEQTHKQTWTDTLSLSLKNWEDFFNVFASVISNKLNSDNIKPIPFLLYVDVGGENIETKALFW